MLCLDASAFLSLAGVNFLYRWFFGGCFFFFFNFRKRILRNRGTIDFSFIPVCKLLPGVALVVWYKIERNRSSVSSLIVVLLA